MDDNWSLKLIGCSTFISLFLLFNRNFEDNPLDCSYCDLAAFIMFLNNQTHLGNANAKCNGTNTYVIDHDFQNCTGKYCERSRTKYDWNVEKFTEMTESREHEYM
jgi:hypothetical protein